MVTGGTRRQLKRTRSIIFTEYAKKAVSLADGVETAKSLDSIIILRYVLASTRVYTTAQTESGFMGLL